tara:strand:- start:479 stop:646 length:168 start_codon:yes stop_codon:yes gene_type:complete
MEDQHIRNIIILIRLKKMVVTLFKGLSVNLSLYKKLKILEKKKKRKNKLRIKNNL